MTKATYKTKHLIGGFITVSGVESTAFVVGSIAADGQVWYWSSG